MTRVASLPDGFKWQYSGAEGFKGRHAYNPSTGERLSTRQAQDRQSQAHGFKAYSYEREASRKSARETHEKGETKSASVHAKGVTDIEKAQKRLLERGQLKADKRSNVIFKTEKRGYASRTFNSSEGGGASNSAGAVVTEYEDDDPGLDLDSIDDFEFWEYD